MFEYGIEILRHPSGEIEVRSEGQTVHRGSRPQDQAFASNVEKVVLAARSRHVNPSRVAIAASTDRSSAVPT
jgi:hypothetical protein